MQCGDTFTICCDTTAGKPSQKSSVGVLNYKKKWGKGEIVSNGGKSIGCFVYILCNNILTFWFEWVIAMLQPTYGVSVVNGQVRFLDYFCCRKEAIAWFLPEFIGFNAYQLKGNLMTCLQALQPNLLSTWFQSLKGI